MVDIQHHNGVRRAPYVMTEKGESSPKNAKHEQIFLSLMNVLLARR